MAQVFKISRSRYYSWFKSEPSTHKQKDLELGAIIEDVFKNNRGVYGSPRVHRDIIQNKGIRCSRKRVARIMREKGLKGRQKCRFKVTTDSGHEYPKSPNLIGRNFRVMAPNIVWVSDITYIDTDEGWLYLCIVLDLFSRIVVGWSMESHLKAELVITAVTMAVIHRRPSEGLTFHSDQGIQYASDKFREKIDEYKMIQSMSRKGNCWDNACAESFFSTLKLEEVFQRRYQSRDEARKYIFEYIAVFYNRKRSHSFLDFLSPEEYELRMSIAQNVV